MRRAAVLWLAASLDLATAAGARSTLTWALGHEPEGRDIIWQPSKTALALHAYGDKLEDGNADENLPRRTVMYCLGTTTLTRACHFENVYYDISSKRFVYFGPDGATSELFGEEHAGEPWLRLVRGMYEWREQELDTQFHMDWRGGEPLPAAGDVVTYAQPLHLRSTMNTRSIGHLLRDNLMALVDLPLRFGRDPVAFDWVRWESDMHRSGWRNESPVARHYRGLLNKRPSVTWQHVLDAALSGRRHGVKYIQFSEIIGGQGPADLVTHVGKMKDTPSWAQLAAWAHMCDPFPFTAMREVAYRNYGLQVAAVPDLEPFVLFLNGKPGEKRHLTNAEQLIPSLKMAFPGVRMEHVMISKLPLEEQLKLLSQATVVVSNIGSRSFRLIYLPNGASVILVGPPQFEFKLPPAEPGGMATTETVPMPFQEIDSCWAYIGYVNMLQYHVQREEEVLRFKEWKHWTDARDTDIVLDEAKLTKLLRVALQRSDSRSYQGAGTLGAYE